MEKEKGDINRIETAQNILFTVLFGLKQYIYTTIIAVIGIISVTANGYTSI